jgi:ketosteroid isomerase-like protein
MDEDLDAFTKEELIAEARRLRNGIREHRDSSGHELCWHHPKLWGLLPDRSDPQPTVPEWPQFMRGCIRYRQSLDEQLPRAPRSSSELSPPDPKLVALRFNDAINARDLERLVALMTDDHRFIDSENKEIHGREMMETIWRNFFAAFPDYRNDFKTVSSRAQVVFALGRSTCSDPALDGPAIWQATIRDVWVVEWRVYSDSPAIRQSLGLRG